MMQVCFCNLLLFVMTIYRIMLATVVHGGCDDTPASKLFPR